MTSSAPRLMAVGGAHAPAPLRVPLPRAKLAWWGLVLLSLAALGLGAAAFLEQSARGFIATGLRTPGYGSPAWGLYIAFDVFFVGVSFAGITVAAICRLFDIATLKPVTRIAELLTITALLAGACVVLADLGRPAHGLLKLPRFANPSSPFYGTFTLVVAGYMFSSLVFFFLSGRADAARMANAPRTRMRWFYRLWASGYRDTPAQRVRHQRVSCVLALSILPLLVTAHSTLGLIFGLQSGRPGWYSTLMAPAFVVLAGVSGTGMLILVAVGFRRLFRLKERLPDPALRWLGNFLWILALVYIYFTAVEELTASYAGPEADREVAHELITGVYAPVFWTFAGSLFLTFLIPFVLYLKKRTSIAGLVIAGLLSNVAAVCKRVLIVVPSQTHGAMLGLEPAAPYKPTWVEYGILCGLFGLVALAMLLFGRIFPLVPSAHGHGEAKPARDRKRHLVTLFVALLAVGLIVLGLADSFRLWSGPEIDPMIPYSPVIFAGGVMLLFLSAVVYELFPDRRRRRATAAAAAAVRREVERPGLAAELRDVVRLTREAEHAARRRDTRGVEERLREIRDRLAPPSEEVAPSRAEARSRR